MNYLRAIKFLRGDDIIRTGSLMFFAAVLTGGINYFYQIYMARSLDRNAFGEFSALYALSFFLSFILMKTMRDSNTRHVSKLLGHDKYYVVPIFHSRMWKRMAYLGIAAFIIFIALSGYISNFLHIDSISLVILIGAVFLFSWVLPVNLGTMQGLQKFNHLAFNNIITASVKFAVGVGLVALGFGIFGAIFGLLMGAFISLIISFFLLWGPIKLHDTNVRSMSNSNSAPNANPLDTYKKDIHLSLSDIKKYTLHVLLAVTCLTIPTNIDVLIVKHFFTSADTALYNAASVFGRMVFFLPIGITTVMYPKVVEMQSKGGDTANIFWRSITYTMIPTAIVAMLLWLFPTFFLELFYGSAYLDSAPLLKLYAPLMFFFSLTAVLVYYNLAMTRYGIIYLLAVFSLGEVLLIWTFHGTLEIILQILLGVIVTFFVIGFIYTIYHQKI